MEIYHIIFSIVLSCVTGVIGWFTREMWSAIKELKADLAKLREEIPKGYVVKEDYREDMREIKDMLGKIFDELRGKADK